MKKTLFLLVAVAATILFAFKPGEEAEKYPTIKLGTELPMKDYVMLGVSGDKEVVGELSKENGLLVIFSCNTCPFVVQWEDRYDDVMAIANRLEIGVAIVNSNEAKRNGDDSFEMMKKHAEEQKYAAPYLVDANSELANAFGAKTTPHVFLFDAKDKLVYLGAIDDNSKDANAVETHYLNDALYSLAKGKKIENAKTDAKGCSIKRLN